MPAPLTIEHVRAAGLRLKYRHDARREALASPEAQAARLSLAAYGEYVHGHAPAAHHQVWLAALEDPAVIRLLIIAPPGHAKTQWIGINWLAWEIGRNPDLHAIYCANTGPQANSKSVAVRDTVAANPRYREVFPTVATDKGKGWGEREWYVRRADPGDKDATLLASGVGGPILGARADLIVFDDINDEENTATPHQRQKVTNWVERTALTRLVPAARAVAIMTRWHHEDSAAYFQSLGWRVIHMPALNDRDEALWPALYTADYLRALRASSPLTFERVYQGRPTAVEGALFREGWWRQYQAREPGDGREGVRIAGEYHPLTRKIQVLDTAFKTATLNDSSVIATWGQIAIGAVLLDMEEGKYEYPELKVAAVRAYERERPDAVLIEDAASGQSLIQDLKRSTRMPVRAVRPDRDKVSRATAVLDFIASGRVFLPERAPWLGRFIRQHSEFPLGDHDDIVDTTGMALEDLLRPARGGRVTVL